VLYDILELHTKHWAMKEKHYGDNVSYMEKLKVEGVTIIEQLLLSMNL
jgi:hypothetical protein